MAYYINIESDSDFTEEERRSHPWLIIPRLSARIIKQNRATHASPHPAASPDPRPPVSRLLARPSLSPRLQRMSLKISPNGHVIHSRMYGTNNRLTMKLFTSEVNKLSSYLNQGRWLTQACLCMSLATCPFFESLLSEIHTSRLKSMEYG
jgi:hypothetical protein